MITIAIKPVAIAEYKKKPSKMGFSMVCYFDEYLFKEWKEIFDSVHKCAHYAEGFLMENFIVPDAVVTVLDAATKMSCKGLPYRSTYKTKQKHSFPE